MKKKLAGAKKIRLSRETLHRLDPEPLRQAQGALATFNKACEPTSQCTTTTGCSFTACGHC